MVKQRIAFNILLLALLLPPPVRAEPLEPLNFKAMYDFGFPGLRFGKLGIEVAQTPDEYKVVSDIASTGIVNTFSKHASHTTVTGKGSHFAYPAITYETNYSTKRKKRYVKLVYQNGDIVEEIVEPPENRATRPAVTAQERKGASDPLSFLLRIRQSLHDARQNGTPGFRLNVYDGRRLTQVDFTLRPASSLAYGGKQTPVIPVQVRRTLLAGFTASELARHDPKEPALTMYFSDDARLIPLLLEVPFLFGKLNAALVKECGTGESCLFAVK